MRLDLNMTEKDKKLLLILTVIVIIVGFTFLGIRPLVMNYMETKQELETAQKEQEINQTKEMMFSNLQEFNESLKTKTAEATADYYPILKSNEIDRLLTGLAVHNGLQAMNLDITMPEEELTLEPYGSSEDGTTDGTAEGTTTEEPSMTESTYNVGGTTAAPQTDEESTAETQQTETPSTGIYAATAVMTIQGNRDAMSSMLNELTRNYPSIRITGYSWDSDTSATSSGDNAMSVTTYDILNLNLEIYMCTKEGEN